jgi:hypothetical protein
MISLDYKFILLLGLAIVIYFLYREIKLLKNKNEIITSDISSINISLNILKKNIKENDYSNKDLDFLTQNNSNKINYFSETKLKEEDNYSINNIKTNYDKLNNNDINILNNELIKSNIFLENILSYNTDSMPNTIYLNEFNIETYSNDTDKIEENNKIIITINSDLSLKSNSSNKSLKQ